MSLIEKVELRKVYYLEQLLEENHQQCLNEWFTITTEKNAKALEKKLKGYLSALRKNKGHVKVSYKRAKDSNYGRLFAYPFSIQGLSSKIRGFLFTEYTDFDMENAHPKILQYICNKYKIECSKLEYLNNHRNEILLKYGADRKNEQKSDFLTIINSDFNFKTQDKFKKEFKKEIEEIRAKIILEEEYSKIIEEVPQTKTNKIGSALNRILCHYESQILETMEEVFKNEGLEVGVRMFDGCMVYGNHYGNENLIKKLEEAINERFEGLNMKITTKEHSNLIQMPENYKIPEEPVEELKILDNDNEASDYVLKLLEPRLRRTERGRLYLYNPKTRIWENDLQNITSDIFIFVLNCEMYKETSSGLVKRWGDCKPAQSVANAVISKAKRGEFKNPDNFSENLFHTTTKQKLAFKNGVLDLKTRKFYEWDNIDFPYYTTVCINYDYEEIDCEETREVIDKVLEPLFGEKLDLALRYLSRCMGGHIEDKNFATYLGNRNCGKGVFYNLMEGAFGEYVKPILLDNMLKSKFNDTSTAKDMYWLIDLEYCRLAISQEIPKGKAVLKSELIKKICSGGDTITARRNYDREDTQFKTDTSFMMFGNEEIITDKDVYEHRLVFESAYQFIAKEQYNNLPNDSYYKNKYRVADDKVKELSTTKAWHLKMVNIILQYYKEERVVVNMQDNLDEIIKNPIEELLEIYERTDNKEDMVLLRELKDEYGAKIKEELKLAGFVIKICKSRKSELRDKMVVYNLRKKAELQEVDIE